MKQIYIVLTKTGSMLSKVIGLYDGTEYNHVSIALEGDLEKMYSFGRLNPNNPVIGGFVEEGIHKGTFAKFYKTKAKIYSLEVTEKQYDTLTNKIEEFNKNKKQYKYNLEGLFFAALNKNHKDPYKFYCSQFVKYVLKQSDVDVKGIRTAPRPEDFAKLSNAYKIYEGPLQNYSNLTLGRVI